MAYQNRVPKTFCTTREAAEILGVSLRTAQLWSESGLLKAWKTDGGHRRISRESIERLLVVPSRRGTRGGCKPSAQEVKELSLSILIVADEGDLSRLYETDLLRWSMHPRVTFVQDGNEALIRIGLLRPDMVIVDLQRAKPHDLQRFQSIRTVPELAKTCVVVVTDQALADIEAQDGLPFDIPVFPKPIPFDHLRGIAERLAFARI